MMLLQNAYNPHQRKEDSVKQEMYAQSTRQALSRLSQNQEAEAGQKEMAMEQQQFSESQELLQ
jgi:hypothetical protein